MKTKEFKDWLSKNYWSFEETDGDIRIDPIIAVGKDTNHIYFTSRILNENSVFELTAKAIEYSLTPIKEREEEKKYYIILNGDIFGEFLYYLTYYIEVDYYGFGTPTPGPFVKNEFSEYDIEALPTSIKKSIENRLLKKVEVG